MNRGQTPAAMETGDEQGSDPNMRHGDEQGSDPNMRQAPIK